MYRHSFFLLALTCSLTALAGEKLILENFTVIDAVEGLREHQRVVIEEGYIVSVGPLEGPPPDSGNIIDGTGRFLIPGLWDAHVHFTYNNALWHHMPGLLLYHGVTSVRDTGLVAPKGPRFMFPPPRTSPDQGPDIYMAGPLLDGKHVVYDGSPGRPPLGISVPDAEIAFKNVDELHAAGVSLVKAYEMLDPDVFRAIMERATHHGLPVAGHVPLQMSPASVAKLGLDSIEHLRNVEVGCSTEEDDILQERRDLLLMARDDTGSELRSHAHQAHRPRAVATVDWAKCEALLNLFIEREVFQTPTLALMLAFYEGRYRSDSWRQGFYALPPTIAKQWLAATAANEDDATFEIDPEHAAYLTWVRRVVAYLADSSRLMAGTDTPIGYLVPGLSLHQELEALVEFGLTPLQALEAATLTPAKHLGVSEKFGTIAAGRTADLVILESNPLEDIRHSKAINAVVRRGTILDQDALSRLIESAAAVDLDDYASSPEWHSRDDSS